jgi:hypothetical protein
MLDLARDDGPRQVGRPRAERVADPPRIRRINAKLPLLGDDLWLVDDVVTTGATLDACAAVLREAGATRVRALTFARATDQPPLERRGSASSLRTPPQISRLNNGGARLRPPGSASQPWPEGPRGVTSSYRRELRKERT